MHIGHKRLIKKLQMQRYRAKHKSQEQKREFDRAKKDSLKFLWFLHKQLVKLAHSKNIPIGPWVEFRKENDKPEFKRAFQVWRLNNNADNFKPIINLFKFKIGFINSNMTWSNIDPYKYENRQENRRLQVFHEQQEKERKWRNQGYTEAETAFILQNGSPLPEWVERLKIKEKALLEQIRKIKVAKI
jgi:hypothetical protein